MERADMSEYSEATLTTAIGEEEWRPVTKDCLPPEGELVTVLTPGGDVRMLVRDNNLWFLPDMSMYVYFRPVAWKGRVA